MGRSRQEVTAGALRKQKLLRQREAFLSAAQDVATEQQQLQLAAKLASRKEAAAEAVYVRRRASEIRKQVSSGIAERRIKLCTLLDQERKQAEAALEHMQHSASLKGQDIIRRAAAHKEQREKEQSKYDERLRTLTCKQKQDELRLQESKLHMLETLAANDAQLASRCRRQQQEKEEAAVFEALWTEDLNAKRLRERLAIAATLREKKQMKEALLEQIANRHKQRQEEMERIKVENQQEACRLQADAEAAEKLRRENQEQAVQRRKEMDAALISRMKEKQRRQLEEATLERQQLAAQDKESLVQEDRASLMKAIETDNAKNALVLMQQEKQRQIHKLRELDAMYVREQIAAEDRKELERAETEAARRRREREINADCIEQMKEKELRKEANKAAKAEEMKQLEAVMAQHRAALRSEQAARQNAMRAYREALDAQISKQNQADAKTNETTPGRQAKL